MGTRIELHEKLCAILGSSYVYFQPPETIKLKYPCIIYNLSGDKAENADDTLYTRKKRYTVTFITKDADSTIPDKLRLMLFTGFDRCFTVDNLYHFVFTIYF